MKCKKCGSENPDNYKFCMKCGEKLEQEEIKKEEFVTEKVNTSKVEEKKEMNPFLAVILGVFKPDTIFKENFSKFEKISLSSIVALIISGIFMIINLITVVLNTVFEKRYDFRLGEYTTKFAIENIKYIKFGTVIFKTFLGTLGLIFAIAGIYYIGALIIKREAKFSKMVGIASVSLIPLLLCSMILAPIIGIVIKELVMPIKIIGFVYTIILLVEGMSSQISLEGNKKYYYNFVCLSIVMVLQYYIFLKQIINPNLDKIKNLLDVIH